MDNFLETYIPTKLNQEEIHNLNIPVTGNEIESVIKKKKKIFQQTKVQNQMASQVNSIKHLEKS